MRVFSFFSISILFDNQPTMKSKQDIGSFGYTDNSKRALRLLNIESHSVAVQILR